MKNFTIKDAARAVDGEYFGDEKTLACEINGVVIDNREALSGYLFVPIIGERFDGHEFIESAYAAGAVCCLSQKKLETEKPYILVGDTETAFKQLAGYYKSLFDIKTIAVTGSVGKTTTKDMIAAVLEESYSVLKTQGNLNNQTGVPKTLFQIAEETEIAIIEMGMNHFGEIAALAEIAAPDDCFLTNIGDAHIENLGSREGILRAKCEMLEFMRPGGTLFINGDDDLLYSLKESRENVVAYGTHQRNDVRAVNIESKGFLGTEFDVEDKGGVRRFTVRQPGAHMVLNALAAYAAGRKYGMADDEIQRGLDAYVPTGARMNILELPDITILNDVYNANPQSMKAALDVLALASGRKACILGDMFELGKDSGKYHFEVGKYAADKNIDLILCVGKNAADIYAGAANGGGQARHFADIEELKANLAGAIESGDSILVKASRGMALEAVVEALKALHFGK